MRSSIQQYIPILDDIHASTTHDFPCILYDDAVYLFQYSIWSEHSKKFPWKHEAFIVTKVKQLPHTHIRARCAHTHTHTHIPNISSSELDQFCLPTLPKLAFTITKTAIPSHLYHNCTKHTHMASSYATLLSISQPRGYHSVKSNKELTATKVSVGTVSNYNRCCDSTVLTTQASLLMLPITTTQIHPSHISIPSKQIRYKWW